MDGKKDLDDFWNIDDIIPKKKLSPRPVDTSLALISQNGAAPSSRTAISGASGSTPGKEKALFCATELVNEYTPRNPLIKNVKLYAWPSSYNYYEKFKADARYFFSKTGEECAHVPFFSYIPQYHHLTKSELAFYLWFRENARRGEYLYCDFSYIMLYIYELLNIPETQPPETTLKILLGLWRAYRERFPRLDKYLVEWICDFCLINRLEIAAGELDFIYKDIIDSASFKEFYAPGEENEDEAYALLAIGSFSGYDFRKSKYANDEFRELFEDRIVGALARTIKENDLMGTANMKPNVTRRDSFGGALCASDIKRVIEIEYFSVSQSYGLRSVITNAVKYAENAVRASLGIKSRLGNLNVPENVKASIDGYMSENLTRRRYKKEETPEYEKRYETPVSPISSEHAKDIERASWQTTKLLVDTFEEESDAAPEKEQLAPPAVSAAPVSGEDVFADLMSILGEDERAFIKFALAGDFASQRALCERTGRLPEVAAELINSSAADICGDIILEENEGGFAVIDDYREDVSRWL